MEALEQELAKTKAELAKLKRTHNSIFEIDEVITAISECSECQLYHLNDNIISCETCYPSIYCDDCLESQPNLKPQCKCQGWFCPSCLNTIDLSTLELKAEIVIPEDKWGRSRSLLCDNCDQIKQTILSVQS